MFASRSSVAFWQRFARRQLRNKKSPLVRRSQFLLETERYCDRHAQQFALSQEIDLTLDDSEDLLKDKFIEYSCIVKDILK